MLDNEIYSVFSFYIYMVPFLNSQSSFIFYTKLLVFFFFSCRHFFFSKARLCSALFKSRTDDVEARGGADLPRRSLCNEFILLLLKPFKTFLCFQADSERASSSTAASVARRHDCAPGYIEAGSRKMLGGVWTRQAGSHTSDWCILVHFTLPYVVDVVWVAVALRGWVNSLARIPQRNM